MMASTVLAPAPAAARGGRAGGSSAVVQVGNDHRHEWVWDSETVGLFFCADRGCDAHAVCPGCLHIIDVALRAPAAGLFVYWGIRHDSLSGRAAGGASRDGDETGAAR